MPLERSASERAKKRNFHEFRHGKTFSRTEKKFGKDRAHKQMIAVVLSNQRKYGKKHKRSRGKRMKK